MSRELTVIADGLTFPEGPRWHEGRWYFVDHLDGHIEVVQPDGTVRRLATLPAGASGMGWRSDGTQLVVSMQDRRVVALGNDGPVEVADLSGHVGGPLNEMVVGGSGRAYVGSFGSDLVGGEPLRPSPLVRIDPDGTVSIAADDLVFPNGVVLSADERQLIVAESFAFRLTSFDVDEHGGLSGRRVWAAFGEPDERDFGDLIASGITAPDGIALDSEGAIWVSDPAGDVIRVLQGGVIVDRISMGELGSYAVALGGEDGRTLMICANARLGRINAGVDRLGRVLTCRVDVPGAGWP